MKKKILSVIMLTMAMIFCGTPCLFSDNEDEINPHDP